MDYKILSNAEAEAQYADWANMFKVDRPFLSGAANITHRFGQGEDSLEHIVIGYGNRVLSLVTFHVGRRKRGIWGRYLNVYYAYTIPDYRRLGLASSLMRSAEDIARSKEAHRIKSIAGSIRGFYLHRHLGHSMWGVTTEGSIIVDHYLVPEYDLPGVPPNVLGYAPDTKGTLSYTEAESLFREHKVGKAWALLEQ
jgi:GNAT superfamily N-acetyltransferase